jgi:hypothetical protein
MAFVMPMDVLKHGRQTNYKFCCQPVLVANEIRQDNLQGFENLGGLRVGEKRTVKNGCHPKLACLEQWLARLAGRFQDLYPHNQIPDRGPE